MSDPRFKFTDATLTGVFRKWLDGRCESHLVTAESVQRWIAENGQPDPANASPTVDERAAGEVDAKDRLLFGINFDQENRIRVLEGKQEISKQAYRSALIAAWKDLQ